MPITGTALLVLTLSVLFANTISTITGFGTAVLALPLCCIVLGVHQAVPLVALMSMVSGIYMTLRAHREVQWPVFVKILAWGSIGYIPGNLAYHYLPGRALKVVAGLFVISVALLGFWRIYRPRPRRPWKPLVGPVVIAFGGMLQGALSTGGSVFAAYVHHKIEDKGQFRATLFALWIVFNSIFLVSYFAGRDHSANVLVIGAACLPALAGGIWLGQRIHDWASERAFNLIVAGTLLIAGASLIIK